MKRSVLFFLMASFSLIGFSQTNTWLHGFGTSGDDLILDIAVDGSGNSFMAGQMGVGSITIGSDVLTNTGNPNGFLAKYNSSGQAQWGILLLNYAGGRISGVEVDAAGNVYIVGVFTDSLQMNPKGSSQIIRTQSKYQGNQNFFVAKYNTSGVLQWADFMQSMGEWDAHALVLDASNNVYVTGSGYDNLVNSSANDSAMDLTGAVDMPFIAKFTPTGSYSKAITLRTGIDQNGAQAFDIGLGQDNRLVICGSTEDTLMIGGSNKVPDITNLKPDIFVAKYNTNLDPIWGVLIGSEDEDEAKSLALTDSSQVWIVGSMQGSYTVGSDNLSSNGASDIIVAKLDSNGTPHGAFNIGGNNNDGARDISLDNNQNIWITGNFTGSGVDFDPGTGSKLINGGTGEEGFIAQYDKSGGFVSAVAIGEAGSANDHGEAIHFSGTSDLFLGGYFSSSSSEFNPNGSSKKLNNLGDKDGYIAKYNTSSCPVGNATSIHGSTKMCMDANSTFSTPLVANATVYTWKITGDPQTIISGQGTNSIVLRGANLGGSTIEVTPGNGTCTGAKATLSINVSSGPTFDNINVTNPTCGLKNGSVSVSMNGAGPFAYLWSNGSVKSNPDSLGAGAYNVTVTDSSTTCGIDSLVAVNDNGAPQINVKTKDPNCFGEKNGSIDLTISGGTAPISYLWSNGDTTEDVSMLEAGGHRVVVTDAKGCTNSKIIYLTQAKALKISLSITDVSSCGLSDGGASANVSGGNMPYKYVWSSGASTKSISSQAVGAYKVVVTDTTGCSDSIWADISDAKGPSISLDSMRNVTCQATDGAAFISGSFTSPISYNWSNSSTNEDLTGVSAGSFTVTATSGACKGIKTVKIMDKAPAVNPICMMTVDDSSRKNLCAFERMPNSLIDRYLIYKESWQAGFDHNVGWLSADSLSIWIDPLSDPKLKAWTYKLAVLNKCGVMSEKSAPHTTIHMVVEAGPAGTNNLRWAPYQGFAFDSVYIERFTQAGDWVVIDSVPASVTNYTDVNPPLKDKTLQYALTIKHPKGCIATRANSKNLNSTRSNRSAPPSNFVGDTGDTTTPKPNVIVRMNHDNKVSLFPNPNDGNFSLLIEDASIQLKSIQIAGLRGRIIWFETISEGQKSNEHLIQLSNTMSGGYILRYDDADGPHFKRFIIQ